MAQSQAQQDQAQDQDFIPELLALMPLSARDVLICDGGGLARAYRAINPVARITGIGDVDAASVDRVIDGPVANLTKSRLGGPFDLVVINETLGRSADPARLLGRLASRLAPGGHLVTAYRNDSHWSRMQARLEGRAVAQDALAPESVPALMAGAGLVMRRSRARPAELPASAQPWIDGFLRLGAQGGIAAEGFRTRLSVTHFVAVATRPQADAAVVRPVRLHQIELVPMMDVRTVIPAAALGAEPALTVSRVLRDMTVPDFGRDGGIVLLQRPRLAERTEFSTFVAACQRRGALVIIEYDDDPSLVARVLGRDDAPEVYFRNMAMAHGVQTSTEVLARQFRHANPEVMAFANVAADLPPPRAHQAGPLRVLFAALNRSRTDEMARLLEPAIAAQPDMIFEVIHDRAFFDALPTAKKRLHALLPYRDYLDLMGRCDICLMPLEGLPDEMGKSDVKWVEAASRGTIAIASPAVYGQTIRHGENGFIAQAPGDWSRLLTRLVADPDLRNRVAATARAELREGRMMAQQVAQRRDWYLDLMARRDQIHAAAIRRSPMLAAAMAKDHQGAR